MDDFGPRPFGVRLYRVVGPPDAGIVDAAAVARRTLDSQNAGIL